MDYRENSRKIVAILLIICSSGFLFCMINSFINYNQAQTIAGEFKDDIKIEMITITASDGVDINAYLFVNNTNWEKTDSSVPLVICCHGMNNGPLQLQDLGYTLATRGYAVLLPETRGHQSNSGGLTFGSKEPWDIIGLMDYLEANENRYSFINTTNQAIIGTSLGGFMATFTYIFESLGKKRLNALVSLAGPLNVSRAIDLYTTTPNGLGDSPFLGNLTGINDKNPINYINSTFPSNVLIRHGTSDNVVDFQCSVDFMNILNETGTRTDIEYHVIPNAGHEVAGNATSMQHAIAWVDKYLIFNSTNFEHIEIINPDFNSSYANDFFQYLKISCYFFIFIIPFAVYLVKPGIFKTKKDEEIEGIDEIKEIEKAGEDESKKNKKKPPDRATIRNEILKFFGLVFTAGIIALFFLRTDILKELMLTAVMTSGYVVYLYFRKFPENTRQWCNQSINPKVSMIWISSMIFSMGIYHIFPNIPYVQESILSFGFRITLFTPFFIILIVISNISNMMFVRYLLSDKKFAKIRKIGPIINGLLMMTTIFVFLFWDLNANLFGLPLAVLIALGLFLAYIIIDYLAQIGEILGKSVIISPIIVALIISLLIFSNNNIFFFF